MALRWKGVELGTIADLLRVQDMGPADHIYTKHEAEASLESGDAKAAEGILQRARERVGSLQNGDRQGSIERGRRMEW